MNLKVNDTYLQFDDDIEVERQVKLFESASETPGDFSWDFSLPPTTHNLAILQLYSINQAGKIIYSKIPASIDNNGLPVYRGFLKVERKNRREISCSFFSGNSSWMELLNFNLRAFDFSTFDKDFTKTEIVNRESATEGLTFPVIDTGAMTTRRYVNWHLDDFNAWIYVHSVIRYLFNRNGLKLEGDILQDWRYLHLISSNNTGGVPQEEINDRKTYVGKSSGQSITVAAGIVVVTFPDTTGDRYPGSLWNTGTHRFTADYEMEVDITYDLTVTTSNILSFRLYKNGTFNDVVIATEDTGSITIKNKRLYAGDYIDFRVSAQGGTGTVDTAQVTITPKRIYRVYSRMLLPDMPAKDFVAQVFNLFNPVIDFNALTQTVTVNLFKNVIRKEEIDISEFVDPESIEEDFAELVQSYGRLNSFKYSEADSEAAEEYNDNNEVPYGAGQLDSENDFTEVVATLYDTDFVAAVETNENPFKTYLPRFDWRNIEETAEKQDGVTVTLDGTLPRFTVTAIARYFVGDIVRISNSTEEAYNGDHIISSTPTTQSFIVAGLSYTANATCDVVIIKVVIDKKEEQALLLCLPNYALNDFTNNTIMFYADNSSVSGASSPSTGYFYKPLQALDVDDIKQSLSFGAVNIKNAHQTTMLSDYWRDFDNIIKDPVKVIADANFPVSVFETLFTAPLRLQTDKFNSQFFMRRVRGYKKSNLPCEIELIKL
jgi:hypothetical protein